MLEVADIFREVGPAYRARFGARMPPSHQRAMRDIELCRTAALGGHLTKCDHCGESGYSYHSCRNRHCPKCHRDPTERWLEAWRSRLLPCPYFLLTFTLPEELRALARAHQKAVYGALMRSAASALQKLAADPRYLGARPGMIAVLHTWTRNMLYHPHVHVLVTAGGLDRVGGHWVPSRNPAFLLPCRALSVIIDAMEFTRRFLQHVLPRSYVKVRSYGLYSTSSRPSLEHARRRLAQPAQGSSQGSESASPLSSRSNETSQEESEEIVRRICSQGRRPSFRIKLCVGRVAFEAVLGLLEPIPIAGRDADRGVQREAVQVGTQSSQRLEEAHERPGLLVAHQEIGHRRARDHALGVLDQGVGVARAQAPAGA